MYDVFFFFMVSFHHYSLLNLMLFLSKKPSVVPRVLCASECPPHNVLHEIDDYPRFYEPTYFPCYYDSIFVSEESVCGWLLSSLQNHSENCCTHSQHIYHAIVTSDHKISSITNFFHFFLDGVHFSVPFDYIESPLFSFLSLTLFIWFTSLKSWALPYSSWSVGNKRT